MNVIFEGGAPGAEEREVVREREREREGGRGRGRGKRKRERERESERERENELSQLIIFLNYKCMKPYHPLVFFVVRIFLYC